MSDSAKKQPLLGNYQILEKIGTGGERHVFKAVCLTEEHGVKAGELVALNCLRDREGKVFDREAEILGSLNHPNIIQYRHSFVTHDHFGDLFCLVMELLEGKTLKAHLDETPQGLPWSEARDILRQILAALQYASEHQVVHRDLKPSNIFITRDRLVKLIDFGIARRHRDEDLTATIAGVKGSFDYMAPDFARATAGEIFHGDETSDVFSFGILLYQVLTGKLPLEALGGSEAKYRARWLSAQLPEFKFSHSVFRVLPQARDCVRKCLAVERARRLSSFTAVTAEFSKVHPFTLHHNGSTYEFVELLGKGGFGEVFRAKRNEGDGCRVTSDKGSDDCRVTSDGIAKGHPGTEADAPVTCHPSPVTQDVAVKRLLQSAYSKRFVREARILQEHAHPNLVRYLDFIEVPEALGPLYFLILEFLPGMPGATLRERVRKSEAGLDPVELLRLFSGYLDCLQHLHQQGIIHRDLKPGNLYAPEGDPASGKIFDLGIAHDEEGTCTHGQVPGTLDYMPPEFATEEKGRGSPQSDIFALGVTLYQALTKSLPFPRLPEKETEAWLAFFERSQKPLECPFDHAVFNQYPELIGLLRRALAAEPAKRHINAGEMRDELHEILQLWETREPYEKAVAAALAALSEGGYEQAETEAKAALALRPRDQAAKNLLIQATEGQRNRLYAKAVATVRTALAAFDYGEAERQAQEALKHKPADAAAGQLLAQARQSMRRFETALKEAETALGRGDFVRAEQQAKQALILKPGDPAASALSTQVQEAKDRKSQCDAALTAAKAALSKERLWEAEDHVQRALQLLPEAQSARELLGQIHKAKHVQTEYERIISLVRSALRAEEFSDAKDLARQAVRLKPQDPIARQLLAEARQERRSQVGFDTAVLNARQAIDSGNFALAEQFLGQALELRPKAPAAQELLAEAQEAKRRTQSCSEISELPTDRFTLATLAHGAPTNDGLTAATMPFQQGDGNGHSDPVANDEAEVSAEELQNSRPATSGNAEPTQAPLPASLAGPQTSVPSSHGTRHSSPPSCHRSRSRRRLRFSNKRILLVTSAIIVAVASILVFNQLRNNLEVAKMNSVKEFTLHIDSSSPEIFPLAGWSAALKQAEANAQSKGRYARQWSELTTNLLFVGGQFPAAHAAAFQRAFTSKDLVNAERLFNQWKRAQPLLSKIDFSGDYRHLRDEMERDLGGIRASRRNPDLVSGANLPAATSTQNPSATNNPQPVTRNLQPATNNIKGAPQVVAIVTNLPALPNPQPVTFNLQPATNSHVGSPSAEKSPSPATRHLSPSPGDALLTNPDYDRATDAFAAARQTAKSLGNQNLELSATQKLRFAEAMKTARKLAQTNPAAAFSHATNALAIGRRLLSEEQIVAAEDTTAVFALGACSNLLSTTGKDRDAETISQWLRQAKAFARRAATLNTVRTMEFDLQPSSSGSLMSPIPVAVPGNLNLLGIEFVWVAGISGNGAYVAATELSQAQFKALTHRNLTEMSKMRPRPATEVAVGDDKPMNLTFEEAKALCAALNNGGAAQTLPVAGRFSLPTRADFLVCAGLAASTQATASIDQKPSSNPTFADVFAQSNHLTAVVNGISPPVSVQSGSANKLGLYHVLGNAWEWCLDSKEGTHGVPAGFSFFSTGFGRSKDLFSEWGDWSQELTGLRLIFIPETGNFTRAN